MTAERLSAYRQSWYKRVMRVVAALGVIIPALTLAACGGSGGNRTTTGAALTATAVPLRLQVLAASDLPPGIRLERVRVVSAAGAVLASLDTTLQPASFASVLTRAGFTSAAVEMLHKRSDRAVAGYSVAARVRSPEAAVAAAQSLQDVLGAACRGKCSTSTLRFDVPSLSGALGVDRAAVSRGRATHTFYVVVPFDATVLVEAMSASRLVARAAIAGAAVALVRRVAR